MKKITLLLTATLFAANIFAQDAKEDAAKAQKEMEETDITKLPDGWKKSADVLFGGVWTNTDNWQGATDKYNITGTLNTVLKADQKKGRALWLNELRWVYGGIMAPSTNNNFRKAQDQLLASSMYAPQIRPKWFYGVKFNLNTQVLPGENYSADGKVVNRNSGFLAPGVIRLGVGILYRPTPNFKIYFSPLTANIATRLGGDNFFQAKNVLDKERFGIAADKSLRFGLGAMATVEYNTTILKNINYKTRLDVFTDYLREPFSKNDVDWLNSFNFNLTKNIAVGAVFNVRYYHFIAPRMQYLHTIGLSGAIKLDGLGNGLSRLKKMVK
jgi:Protein of unknown function (DUF3078)